MELKTKIDVLSSKYESLKNRINTEEATKEELESFEIIKAILRKDIGVEKIHHRDTQSYFGVLYDNNNRKPICRLFLDGRIKRIELFDQNKTSRKIEINTIDDIYNFSEDLLSVANYYKNEDLKQP
ncbi:hypothetical protein N9Q03_00620 [Flavobacteriaceae bacterium]|jgi:hypothetical protein|nr:hypothetical protein [Flavobacteriaceae bacterium]